MLITKGDYEMEKGLLIVLSGPSGVGKGTVRRYLEQDPSLHLVYSTSMTTRQPRNGEKDGVDYYFVSKEEFEKHIEKGDLLEHASFVGNYYGTPAEEVERLRNEGKNVLLEIEVQGAQQIAQKVEDVVSIFLTPPSMDELENRIRKRASEPEEIIQERLAKAEKEMKLVSQYKYTVCNEDPQLAADMIKAIIKKHMSANA
jgi:guanylate kinase